jgi:hypothetical protein
MKKILFLLLIAGGCLFATAEAEAGRRGRGFHNYHHHNQIGFGRPGFSINVNRGYPGAFGYGYGSYYRPYRRSVGISIGPGYGYYGGGFPGGYPAYGGGYCY